MAVKPYSEPCKLQQVCKMPMSLFLGAATQHKDRLAGVLLLR